MPKAMTATFSATLSALTETRSALALLRDLGNNAAAAVVARKLEEMEAAAGLNQTHY